MAASERRGVFANDRGGGFSDNAHDTDRRIGSIVARFQRIKPVAHADELFMAGEIGMHDTGDLAQRKRGQLGESGSRVAGIHTHPKRRAAGHTGAVSRFEKFDRGRQRFDLARRRDRILEIQNQCIIAWRRQLATSVPSCLNTRWMKSTLSTAGRDRLARVLATSVTTCTVSP